MHIFTEQFCQAGSRYIKMVAQKINAEIVIGIIVFNELNTSAEEGIFRWIFPGGSYNRSQYLDDDSGKSCHYRRIFRSGIFFL